jgi:hypothetical protein
MDKRVYKRTFEWLIAKRTRDMVDVDTLVIVGLSTVAYPAKKGVDLLSELVGSMLNPVAKEAGEALREWFARRLARGVMVVTAAADALKASGVTPQKVPGRILWPIVEKASLEEDDDVRAVWSHLLASAANPHGPDVIPAFGQVLSELSPDEVKRLHDSYAIDVRFPPTPHVPYSNRSGPLRSDGHLPAVIAENLVRLRILAPTLDTARRELAIAERNGGLVSYLPRPKWKRQYHLTAFGAALLRACFDPPTTRPNWDDFYATRRTNSHQ